MHNRTGLVLMILSLFGATIASADTAIVSAAPTFNKDCNNQIKECFMQSGAQRSECFYLASQRQGCQKSTLGDLLNQRWSMTPDSELHEENSSEGTSALMGPRLIDSTCIENFDSQWSAALMRGNLSETQVAGLRSILDGCAKSDDVVIPSP